MADEVKFLLCLLLLSQGINGEMSETTTRSNNNACKQSRFLLDLLSSRGYLVHYTPRVARKRCECIRVAEGTNTARAGQVSLKKRVAIPVST